MKARAITRETVLDIGVTDRKYPEFKVGDTIEITQSFKEGDKERSQSFEGDLIALHNNGVSSTMTVRRIGANGVGVEKIFPYYSPTISNIRVIKNGMARRAKLFYVRERLGKSAKIKERVLTKKQKETSSSTAQD
jgi:large subunit ribosomal protein L19